MLTPQKLQNQMFGKNAEKLVGQRINEYKQKNDNKNGKIKCLI